MDLFQHRYYRLGKTLMSLIGQWPYQSARVRRWILAVFILFVTYQMIAQIQAVVKYRDDWNVLVQCLVPNFFAAVCAGKHLGFVRYSKKKKFLWSFFGSRNRKRTKIVFIKYRDDWNVLVQCLVPNFFAAVCAGKHLGFVRYSKKILQLLNRIGVDWQVWARDEEVKILHEYAERGKNITIVFTATFYSSMFFSMIQPIIKMLINAVLMNGTEPGKFLFPVVYYHLDMQKYYFYLLMYYTVCQFMILTFSISSDVMLILYVQHVCGIFAAVGHKLERIGSNDTFVETEESTYAFGNTDMIYLGSCIDRHNDAIEYADLISASYAWNFFVILGFGMILINALGLQILLGTSDLGTTITSTILTLALLFNFYIECGISQILMDHSIRIRFYIHSSKWYRLSPKAQKLLQLMTIRCNVPCRLTAGEMLTMSVQNFGMVFRTFMSYFTFIRSIHVS